ncbi:hypothetical protein [Arcobacter arenosus]|jgi:hypothetical protein|uniref:Uncharacterized protein n=1 Tax=Arcobacter arenosus TaxID=2576037 RepID=A0A5R8XZM5_9BACT|nr:hypothetical protein [Arcobacter arenosus]TLP37679.1 hypothetical protein FDK22_10200 [Arcobacter arenosus]
MKLKYTGPKELISPHGVSFKRGKDDKYVYIHPAIQIYNAIHHDYEKDKIYTLNIEGKRLNDNELTEKILQLKPELKEYFDEEIESIKNYLDKEIESINGLNEFTEDEKKIYKNNLIIMKNYRIQRAFNKTVYTKLIEIIVDDIFIHKLKEINAPFNERFWHIFQTIQGELSNHNHRSIGSKLDILHDDDYLSISLKINSIG